MAQLVNNGDFSELLLDLKKKKAKKNNFSLNTDRTCKITKNDRNKTIKCHSLELLSVNAPV